MAIGVAKRRWLFLTALADFSVQTNSNGQEITGCGALKFHAPSVKLTQVGGLHLTKPKQKPLGIGDAKE